MYSRDEGTSGGSGSMGHPGLQTPQNSLESRRYFISPRNNIGLILKAQCKADHTQLVHRASLPGKSDRRQGCLTPDLSLTWYQGFAYTTSTNSKRVRHFNFSHLDRSTRRS